MNGVSARHLVVRGVTVEGDPPQPVIEFVWLDGSGESPADFMVTDTAHANTIRRLLAGE